MTEAEKAKIRKAIRLIKSDDGYEEGMDILCKMCGLRSILDTLKDLKPVSMSEICKAGDRPFRAPGINEPKEKPE